MKLIECVPNFSEGRDMAVVAAIRDAIAAVPGISVLHVTADASHNRSVITFVGPYDQMAEAAVAGIRTAAKRIDLSRHEGVHPRMGAADVVPFIPLDGATMDDCIALARATGERVGRELGIPVYLYEHAATQPGRQNLADVRRGGFEAIARDLAAGTRAPDFGPPAIHPHAGAVAIGARPFLIAFNIYLGDRANLPVAREIARTIRAANGGLPGVKALALEVDRQAQVSMNLVDIDQTSLSAAYDAVEHEARARGVEITWSEIIGLVPERALLDVTSRRLKLREPAEAHSLERRILDARWRTQTLHGFVHAIGSTDPAPGGGSVAAYVGALCASLVRMVAGVTMTKAAYAAVHADMESIVADAERIAYQLADLAARDADAYSAVMAAYRRPRSPETDAERDEAVRSALLHAARIPLQVALLCARVAELTVTIAEHGTPRAITDAATAALMADAACRSAAYNVRVNVQQLRDGASRDGAGADLQEEAEMAIAATARWAAAAMRRVEDVLRPAP